MAPALSSGGSYWHSRCAQSWPRGQPCRQGQGGRRGVGLETLARGWLWVSVQAVPLAQGARWVRAGLGWEGRRQGWAGRDPAREMMYGQMYQIAQDKQAVNFIRAHHGFNLAA